MEQPKANINLALTDNTFTERNLQQFTRDLAHTLDRQEDIDAALPATIGEPGYKGDPITIGAIVLTLVGSRGVVTALINVFKSYVERQPSVEFSIETSGRKLTLKAQNLKADQVQRTVDDVERLLRG